MPQCSCSACAAGSLNVSDGVETRCVSWSVLQEKACRQAYCVIVQQQASSSTVWQQPQPDNGEQMNVKGGK